MPCMGCTHGHPHKHNEDCMKWPVRCVSNSKPCKCVPVKASNPQPSPVPTSGTGTAPASGTVSGVGGMTGADIERISQSGARILPPDKKDGHYPGMAKDIGDLKLLYDRLDRENDKQFVAIEKVERKFKELKGQYGDYNFGNRVKRLETALKALQEEVAGIKKNPILLLRDRTPATFTTTWENPIQYTQTTDSYNPCQNCQKLLLYRQQLAIGGGQTSAAMQNPCDNCPSRPGYTTTSLQPQ